MTRYQGSTDRIFWMHVGGRISVRALFRDDEGMVYMLGASAPLGTDPAKLVECIEAQIKVWPRALREYE